MTVFGTQSVSTLTLDAATGASATLVKSGTATFTVGTEYIGDVNGGTNTHSHNTGTHTVTTALYLGQGIGSNGNYELSNATLT